MKRSPKALYFLAALLLAVYFLHGYYLALTQNFAALSAKALHSSINAAIVDFSDKYGYPPGDLPNAEKILPNCEGCSPPIETAGDGIIGEADFTRTLRHQASNNEPELFWRHLRAAGFDVKREHFWGEVIVGYSDGKPLPPEIGHGTLPKGNILILMSRSVINGKPVNAAGIQALTPSQAAAIDNPGSKFDDGAPDTGWIQAYGAPDCTVLRSDVEKRTASVPQEYTRWKSRDSKYTYDIPRITGNSGSDSKDCGLIFKLYTKEHVGRAQENAKSAPNAP